jgi:hypothetical protein
MQVYSNTDKKTFPIETISAVLLVMIYLGLIVFALWTSNKGLTIKDEGFHLLQAKYPDDVLASASSYYYYSALVFKLAGYNVVAFRLSGLFLMFVSTSIFCFGFLNILKLTGLSFPQTRSFRINCWAFLGLGMMLYYSSFIQHRLSLSYNTLDTVALYSALGLFLSGVSLEKDTGKKQVFSAMAFLLTGVFIGIAFFIKFPTAIVLLVMFSLLSATGIMNHCGRAMMMILAGFFLWLLLHFIIFQTPAECWENFNRSRAFVKHHAFSYLITDYYNRSLDLLKASMGGLYRSYILLLSGFALFFVLQKTKVMIFKSKNVLLFLPVFMLAGFELYSKVSNPGAWGVNVIKVYASWLVLLLIVVMLNVLFHWINHKMVIKRWRPLLPLCLLFFCSPFAGAIGTVNNININLVLHLAPWFGLMLVLMMILSDLENSKIIIPAGTLIIGIFVAAHILYGAINPAPPYQANGLLKLTEPTDIGSPVTSLKLDVETSRFYRDVRRTARENGFHEGDDVLAFFDMPGLVFAMGGKSPGLTWYFGNWYVGANDAIDYVMSFVNMERLKKAFVLQSSNNQKLPDLGKVGIKFPQEYVLCGAFLFPGTNDKILLWKPQNFKPSNDF